MKKQVKELSLSGIFYRRRDQWIKHVLTAPKDRLSHVEKLVAVYIAGTINPESRAWVTSQERIASDMDIGVRIVKSAVAKLRDEGLLETKRVRVNGNPKRFNAYSIVAVEDAIPVAKVHGGART